MVGFVKICVYLMADFSIEGFTTSLCFVEQPAAEVISNSEMDRSSEGCDRSYLQLYGAFKTRRTRVLIQVADFTKDHTVDLVTEIQSQTLNLL